MHFDTNSIFQLISKYDNTVVDDTSIFLEQSGNTHLYL